MSRGAYRTLVGGVAVAATACSLLVSTSDLSGGPDDRAAVTDAASPEDASGDAGGDVAVDAPLGCDLKKPFGAPSAFPAPINSTGNDITAFLSADGLSIYFSSDRTTAGALFVASRPSLTGTWGSATLLSTLDSPQREGEPWVSPDQLTIYFDSSRTDAPLDGGNLYFATRTGASGTFGAPSLVPNVNSVAEDLDPWLSPSADTLWFDSTRGSSSSDLYASTRAPGGAFGTPAPITELNTSSREEEPVLTADALTIFFSSDRPGGVGKNDIWTATRASATSAFGAPQFVAALSTTADEWPTWVSGDGCRIIVQSYVAGNSHIYYAVRPP